MTVLLINESCFVLILIFYEADVVAFQHLFMHC